MPAQTTFKAYEIKIGELTEAEKDQIFELSSEPHNRGPYRIGRQISRHPSTVAWFMYRNGLRKLSDKPRRPYKRCGVDVIPFSPEEDHFIVERRKTGETLLSIATALAGIFPTQRTADSVGMRIVMLASNETACEDDAVPA